MVLEVRSEVRKLAMSVGHDQFPAVYDQLDGSFQFVPKSVKPQPEMEPCGIAESIWRALSDSNDVAALSAFATTYSLICPEIAEAARERLSDLDTEKSQVSVADQTTKRSDAELYRVRPEGALNARTGPSAETAILRTLDPGTRIRELEREGDWSKVILPDDAVGWVHNGFIVTENEYDRRITLTQPNAEMIAESAPLDNASDVDQVFEAAAFRVRPEGALNARVGPSAEDEILRVLPAGTELREVERQGDWSRVVLPDDASGWVHNGFIVTEEDYEMRLAAMKQTEDGKTEDAPLKNGASFRIPRGLLAQPSGEIDLMNVCAWGYSQYSVDFVYTSSSRFLGGATNLAKGMVPDEATWQRCYMLDNPCVATGSIGATFHIGAGRTIKDAIAALETRFRSSGVAAGCR